MLTITHTWTCDYCRETKVLEQKELMMGFQVVDYLYVPGGWSVVGSAMVCPKHTIKVQPTVGDTDA